MPKRPPVPSLSSLCPPLTYLQWKVLNQLLHMKQEEQYRWFHITHRGRLSFCSETEDCNTEASRAGKALTKTAYVKAYTDQFRTHYRITELGRGAVLAGAPEWAPPAPPPLREIEHRVLDNLVDLNLTTPDGMWTPLAFGGSNGSGHSEAAYRLVLHGLAEMRGYDGKVVSGPAAYPKPRLFRRGKGSRRFRVTAAGIAYHKAREEKGEAS